MDIISYSHRFIARTDFPICEMLGKVHKMTFDAVDFGRVRGALGMDGRRFGHEMFEKFLDFIVWFFPTDPHFWGSAYDDKLRDFVVF